MPEIATAVQQFSSEAIQSEVFRALMDAFGTSNGASGNVPRQPEHKADAPDRPAVPATPMAPVKKAAPKKVAARQGQTPKVKQSFSLDKSLDFVKGGSPSFRDFVESKKPRSVLEKCLVSVYWLTRHAHNPTPATVEQVYTCFKAASWQVPSDLVNTLQQAGSKGWLDTRKRDDLKVVVQGENHIEHEMPAKSAQGD